MLSKSATELNITIDGKYLDWAFRTNENLTSEQAIMIINAWGANLALICLCIVKLLHHK